MERPAKADTEKRRWESVAKQLEDLANTPTPEQMDLAVALGMPLSPSTPAPVAAALLRHRLHSPLNLRQPRDADIPDVLTEIEDELGVERLTQLTTGSLGELRAWFEARYMLKTARGLRALQPDAGDVVASRDGGKEQRVVSSVGDNGRIYFKGRWAGSAWPNNLEPVSRVGSPEHGAAIAAVDAVQRNASRSTTTNFAKFNRLADFALESHIPGPEAIRALQDLIESGEQREEPFQQLITRHPALLGPTVLGGWRTYVIPKKRLGAEYVPDFLVLGINSTGPQWLTVELEAARHQISNQNGTLSGPTRHASQQILDWREWLTTNVAYAQDQLGLYGLTNRAPGLVVIGRDTPSAERRPSRAQSEEGSRISVHSWDWLLRSAINFSNNGNPSMLAVENARSEISYEYDELDPSMLIGNETNSFEELDLDELLSSEGF